MAVALVSGTIPAESTPNLRQGSESGKSNLCMNHATQICVLSETQLEDFLTDLISLRAKKYHAH